MKKIVVNVIIPVFIILVSIFFGIIFNDYKLGLITLMVGFLNAYYAAIGKWYNYIFGIIFSLTYSATCFYNGLYGFAIFNVLFYMPSQIYGIIKWKKKEDEDHIVKIKSLTLKSEILLTLSISAGSAFVGFLLNLLPGQQLSYLDATSQLVNVGGTILSALVYRESWYIWLVNNVLDLTIWIINFSKKSTYSEMMLVVSIIYLIMNIYGLINWIIIENKQSKKCRV